MLKILYAAGNSSGAKIQLSRFLTAMAGKPFIIKIAAYKKSSPCGQNIDWTLDCLPNIFRPDHISLENENFETYYQQVKYYNPDLVISDLEYFTSCVANDLNITLWQCSSLLLNFGIDQKYNLGLFKNFSYLLQRNNAFRTQRIINLLDNSNCNFIYSHFGEAENTFPLKANFEWIRPYYSIGKVSVPCQHHVVAAVPGNEKKILSFLQQQNDVVVFTEFSQEKYTNLWLKDIADTDEYFCNLKNCDFFACEGQSSFLSDAFYNKKYSMIITDFHDLECVANSLSSKHLGLGSMISQTQDDVELFRDKEIKIHHREDIQFLHQKVEDL